jgi:hypothetical protein
MINEMTNITNHEENNKNNNNKYINN